MMLVLHNRMWVVFSGFRRLGPTILMVFLFVPGLTSAEPDAWRFDLDAAVAGRPLVIWAAEESDGTWRSAHREPLHPFAGRSVADTALQEMTIAEDGLQTTFHINGDGNISNREVTVAAPMLDADHAEGRWSDGEGEGAAWCRRLSSGDDATGFFLVLDPPWIEAHRRRTRNLALYVSATLTDGVIEAVSVSAGGLFSDHDSDNTENGRNRHLWLRDPQGRWVTIWNGLKPPLVAHDLRLEEDGLRGSLTIDFTDEQRKEFRRHFAGVATTITIAARRFGHDLAGTFHSSDGGERSAGGRLSGWLGRPQPDTAIDWQAPPSNRAPAEIQTAAAADLATLRGSGGSDWSLKAADDDPFRWPGTDVFMRCPPFFVPNHPEAAAYRFVLDAKHLEPVELVTDPRSDVPVELWIESPVNLDDRRVTSLTVTALDADGKELAVILDRRCKRRPPPIALDSATLPSEALRRRAAALADHTAGIGTFRIISDPRLMPGRPPTHGKIHFSDSYVAQGLLGSLRAAYQATDDPVRRAALRARARMGAAYLDAAAGGRLGVTEYHWVQFYTTAWAGFAFLDAYAITGDERWRERALRHARMYREMQLPSGTWTWTNRNGGRYPDCGSYFAKKAQFPELATGEFLHFFVRLRLELETDEFRDVEAAAIVWERAQQLRDLRLRYHNYVQSSLAHNSTPLSALHLSLAALKSAEAGTPLLTDDEIALLARYIEDQWVLWRHVGEDGAIRPALTLCGHSRYNVPMTLAQIQMAEICLRLSRRLDDAVWRAKGLSLLNDLLITQQGDGDIHPRFDQQAGGEPLLTFTRADLAAGLMSIADLLDNAP